MAVVLMSYPHYTGESEDWGDGGRICRRWNGPPPKIVVLCGSTRFYEAFQRANYELTMQGKIVLSVGFFMHSVEQAHSEDLGCTPEEKVALDELHKRKLDLADEALVLNVGGYIGESTTSEILYAAKYRTPVRFLEPGCFTLPDGDCIGWGCMHDTATYDTRGDC